MTSTEGLASVALLLSVLGLLGCLPVGATGVALGYVARERAVRDGGTPSRTTVLAIRIGWVAVALSLTALLGLVVAIVVSNL